MLLKKSKVNGNLEIQMQPFMAAGCSHNNDPEDGGMSRQAILSTLPAVFEADLYPTTYNGKFAVKIKDHRTRRVIGWVPKAQLHQFAGMTRTCRATGFVVSTNKGLSAQLFEPVPVKPEEYQFVKNFCQANNIQTPAYDQRAYSQAILQIQAMQAQTVPAR